MCCGQILPIESKERGRERPDSRYEWRAGGTVHRYPDFDRTYSVIRRRNNVYLNRADVLDVRGIPVDGDADAIE